ncbi:MAG: hypothetical protein ACRCWF_15620 [Beijerinckiaceae bacterium]
MGQQPTMHNGPATPDEAAMRNRAAIELAEAMGRARNKQADEDALRADSKLASAARLEAVRAQLAPLYAAIPRDVELFDLGMVTTDKPRLFVDIIAFIEMNKDASTFRFMQETRSGRVLLAETNDEKALRAAVTDYIARRLIERERALAAQENSALQNVGRPAPAEYPASFSSAKAPVKADQFAQNGTPAMLPELAAQAAALQAEVKPIALAAAGSLPSALSMPQTANQAFERWTNATPSPVPAPQPEAQKTAAMDLRPGLPVQPLKAEDGLAAIRQELTERERAYQNELAKSEPVQKEPEAPKPADETVVKKAAQTVVAQPVAAISTAVAQTKTMVANAAASTSEAVSGNVAKAAVAATAATATLATTKALSARKSGGSGWWVWPLLALLIGVGLGALLLYLYAANIMRP